MYYHILSRKIEFNGIYGKRSPVYSKTGMPYLYYAPDKADNVKEAYENFKENIRLTVIDGAKRHTGVTTFFRTFYEAGYDWVGYESMYGPHELMLGVLRGTAKSFDKDNFGTHLALQWSTVPTDDEKHYIRYGLSLYLSYMHGAKEIFACCTHAVLSGPAMERIEKSPIKKLVILDTIHMPEEKRIDKIEILSVAHLLAKAIENIYLDKKMSEVYDK